MDVLGKVSLPISGARMLIRQPMELLDRLESRREKAQQEPGRGRVSPNRVNALASAHEVLGLDSCEECAEEIARISREVRDTLVGHHFNDGGNSLAQLLWALVRHLRPERVVETGVARGVSSAFILDALDRNETGQLYSIDLPPLRRDWHGDGGSAVPDRLRDRWTYVRGASRRALPPLLDRLDTVDLFVHDGLHTYETMTFEFHQVWPHLSKDGVLLADDVDLNLAFPTFARRIGREPLLVAEEGKTAVVGLLRA